MNKAFKILSLSFVLLLGTVFFAFGTSAANENGILYSVSGGEATVTGVDETVTGDVVIPAELGGYPVTALGDRVFQMIYGITSVVIPDSVETIGVNCFNYCRDLESVVIGDGVHTIGVSAFENCPALVSVAVGDNVKAFGNRAFALCRKLTAIRIPAATETIGDSAFANCGALKTADFEEGNLVSIGESAFSDCTKLESVHFYDGIESIGDKAFYCCSSLKTLTIPGSIESTHYYSFNGCTGLTTLVLEEGVKIVGMSSFMSCSSLTNISFPSTLTKIDTYGFSRCFALTELDLSGYENIEEIGYGAFLDCTSLEYIILPEYALYLYDNTFENTRCWNSDENWVDGAFIIGNHFIEYYYLTVPEKYSRYIIPDGIKTLAQNSFSHLEYVSSLVIPSSVESIGMHPFYSSDSLKKLYYTSDETAWNNIYTVEENDFDNQEIIFNYVLCYHESVTEDTGCPSSCDTEGYTAGTVCNGCGEWLEGHDAIPATGNHTGGTATCKSKAVCTVCEKEYGSLNANNHKNITTLKAVAATCTETGKTEGKKCSDCGKVTVAQNIVSAKGHKLTTLKAVAATCTKTGKTEGKKCSVCGTVTVAQKTVAKKAHTYKTTTTRATLKKNGKQVTKCTVCGDVKSTKTIYYPKSIKLSYTTTTYNGKIKKPTVIVKDNKDNTLKKDTDYTVKYASGRKNPGKYTVTVTFKGKYEGTKKLTFTIKPKAPSIKDIYSKTKGKASIKWSNVAGESGFQLYYSTSKDGTYKKVKSYAVNKLAGSKTNLKSGKKYYFKVRAYKKTSSGTVYSSWSSVKSVKVK